MNGNGKGKGKGGGGGREFWRLALVRLIPPFLFNLRRTFIYLLVISGSTLRGGWESWGEVGVGVDREEGGNEKAIALIARERLSQNQERVSVWC